MWRRRAEQPPRPDLREPTALHAAVSSVGALARRAEAGSSDSDPHTPDKGLVYFPKNFAKFFRFFVTLNL